MNLGQTESQENKRLIRIPLQRCFLERVENRGEYSRPCGYGPHTLLQSLSVTKDAYVK